MPHLMVCNLEVPPVYPEVCPPESISYVQNFWDSGLTLDQVSMLMGAVILLWATAYGINRVKSFF